MMNLSFPHIRWEGGKGRGEEKKEFGKWNIYGFLRESRKDLETLAYLTN